MATAKLDIKRELAAIDSRNYSFYENLTDEERKAFSPYVLMCYSSNVQGDRDIQEWFIEMTNELVNKDHWSLSKKHKALIWKLYAGIGIGSTMYHPYMASMGKKEKANKIEKLIAELNPTMKMSEVKLLSGMMNKTDIDLLFDDLGFDKKQRKEYE